MWHTDDEEGDEKGSAEERSGEARSRVKMGCHVGGEQRVSMLRGEAHAVAIAMSRVPDIVDLGRVIDDRFVHAVSVIQRLRS